MQQQKRTADHLVPCAGQPAALVLRHLVHMAAQRFDEQHFRHLGQHHHVPPVPNRPRTANA